MIFDNVENWEYVSYYLPARFSSSSKGSVILTTQVETVATKCQIQIPLNTFDEEEGSRMLLQYLPQGGPFEESDTAIAREISGLVGGLPVAIAHVAGYVSYSQCSLEDLLEIFKQRRRHTGDATTEEDDLPASFRQAAFSYDETLSVVWNVTLRELPNDSQNLMYILAFLNCDAVPEDMLCAVHQEEFLEFLDVREKIRLAQITERSMTVANICRFKRMKQNLLKRRLILQSIIDGEPCLSIHRALQRNIRNSICKDPSRRQAVFRQALTLVRKVFPVPSPIQVPEAGRWLEYQRLLPHVLSLRNAFYEGDVRIEGSRKFVTLLADAGINQWEQGFTREGLLLLRSAEDVLESINFDGAELMKADIHTIIALMFDNTGSTNRAEGLKRRQKALHIRQDHVEKLAKVDRTEETLVYNSLMDYSISLLQYNRYKEAEPIIEKCLVKFREWDTPENIPYEYAKYYHWISMIRMYQGRFTEAIELGKQGVDLMEKTGNSSLANRFRFDLACIVLQSGDMSKALAMHQVVYKARIKISGKANELTLHSCYALGAMHEHLGDLPEAE
jgi:tetratricopeptide (TPR) repeat protein